MRMTASWSNPDPGFTEYKVVGPSSPYRRRLPSDRRAYPRAAAGPDQVQRDTVLDAVKDAARRKAVAQGGHP
jgi:hypothetical protein